MINPIKCTNKLCKHTLFDLQLGNIKIMSHQNYDAIIVHTDLIFEIKCPKCNNLNLIIKE